MIKSQGKRRLAILISLCVDLAAVLILAFGFGNIEWQSTIVIALIAIANIFPLARFFKPAKDVPSGKHATPFKKESVWLPILRNSKYFLSGIMVSFGSVILLVAAFVYGPWWQDLVLAVACAINAIAIFVSVSEL